MRLVAAIGWLGFGVGLFLYEQTTGAVPFRIRGLDISFGWLMLVLALYNLARWYSQKALVEDKSMQLVREARARQSQRRERPEPDPTFDFSDRPAATDIRPPMDQPPSKN